jgi:hypothetical protein
LIHSVLIGAARIAIVAAAIASSFRAESASGSRLTAADVALLETNLQRGKSTKVDVEVLLGPAAGSGGAELPGDSRYRSLWYYGNIEVRHNVTSVRSGGDSISVSTKGQRLLLIFFDGDVYSGFLWISYSADQ